MQNKYYTYMHLLDDRLIYIGIGTKYTQHKTDVMQYPRAFNLSARKKNYKRAIRGRKNDVVVVIIEEFNTRKEALKHEEYLHQLHREKFNFFKDINYRYKLYSQPQSKVLVKRSQSIRCINTNDIFNSIMEASRAFNINSGHISEQLRNQRKTAGKHPVTKEPLRFEYIK